MACGMVNDLISVVFEDYKKYCEKNKMNSVNVLAIKREEGMSSRKGTMTKVETEF